MPNQGQSKRIRRPQTSAGNSPLADVVWGGVDLDQYDEVSLVPLDEVEERRRPRRRESLLELGTIYENEDVEPPIDLQFSLRHILIGQAFIAACLGVMRMLGLFDPKGFAGTLGVLSIAFALLISVHTSDDKRTLLVWWALFTFYLLACIVAFALG